MNGEIAESTAARVAAVIPAAGSGLRMGSRVPKQFMDACGKPLLAMTLETFERCRAVERVFVVVPPGEVDRCRRDIVERFDFRKIAAVVPGGRSRRESVRKGMAAAGDEFEIIVVHDGVRPMVTRGLIEKVIDAARATGAATAGIPSKDTVKKVKAGLVVKTCDRESIWLAQTPQAFRRGVLFHAHDREEAGLPGEATDDASLVERAGAPVAVVPGDEDNIKVTTPRDMELVMFLRSEERRR